MHGNRDIQSWAHFTFAFCILHLGCLHEMSFDTPLRSLFWLQSLVSHGKHSSVLVWGLLLPAATDTCLPRTMQLLQHVFNNMLYMRTTNYSAPTYNDLSQLIFMAVAMFYYIMSAIINWQNNRVVHSSTFSFLFDFFSFYFSCYFFKNDIYCCLLISMKHQILVKPAHDQVPGQTVTFVTNQIKYCTCCARYHSKRLPLCSKIHDLSASACFHWTCVLGSGAANCVLTCEIYLATHLNALHTSKSIRLLASGLCIHLQSVL
jgi:hypothetical protein